MNLGTYRNPAIIAGVVVIVLVAIAILGGCNSNPDDATTAMVVGWARESGIQDIPKGSCGGIECEFVKKWLPCISSPSACPLGAIGTVPMTTGVTVVPTPTRPAPTATMQPPVRIQVGGQMTAGTVTATVTNTVVMAVIPEKVVDYGLGISSLDKGQVQFLFAPEYSFAAQRLWFGRGCPLDYAPGCKNRELFLQIPEKGKTFLTMESGEKMEVTGPNILFNNDSVTFVGGQIFTDTNMIQIGEILTTTVTTSPQWITTVGRRYVGKNGPQNLAIVVANVKLQKGDGYNTAAIRDLWYVVPDGDNGEIARSIPSMLPKPPATPTPTPTATATKPAAKSTPTRTPTRGR